MKTLLFVSKLNYFVRNSEWYLVMPCSTFMTVSYIITKVHKLFFFCLLVTSSLILYLLWTHVTQGRNRWSINSLQYNFHSKHLLVCPDSFRMPTSVSERRETEKKTEKFNPSCWVLSGADKDWLEKNVLHLCLFTLWRGYESVGVIHARCENLSRELIMLAESSKHPGGKKYE